MDRNKARDIHQVNAMKLTSDDGLCQGNLFKYLMEVFGDDLHNIPDNYKALADKYSRQFIKPDLIADNHRNTETVTVDGVDINVARIRFLNKRLKWTGEGGAFCMTASVNSLSIREVGAFWDKFRLEQVFNYEDGDPKNNHEFGTIKTEDHLFCWKINYYDLDVQHHSPDPADESITKRILTIMLASEYEAERHIVKEGA